jgi:hypothetical protein
MGHIKTALELALERTADVKADREGAKQSDAKKSGRALAAAFLDSGDEEAFKKGYDALPKADRESAKEGAADIVLSFLQLPRDKTVLAPTDRIALALAILSGGKGDKQMRALLDQVKAFLSRYFQDLEQLEKAVTQQFAPKLRQKEQELARRSGQEVRIDPRRDPEFQAFFAKNLTQLKGQYQDALDKAKEDLKGFLGTV